MDSVLIKDIFLNHGRYILSANSRWMTWNLFLAIVPFVLSVILFRHTKFHQWIPGLFPTALNLRHRSWLWWLGVAAFIAFLPNAPYVLTDVIHFVRQVQIYSVWVGAFVLVPLFSLFFLAGFLAYVVSLVNLGFYLSRIGLRRYVLGIEVVIHLLSAVGVYLGRIMRFNSWDLMVNLDEVAMSIVEDVLKKGSMVWITVTFILIAFLYVLFKQIALAMAAYYLRDRSCLIEPQN
jgi:uncharacterized membrane protein